MRSIFIALVAVGLFAHLAVGCDAPHTTVVVENRYPTTSAAPLVIYRATWHAVALQTPVLPGSSSDAIMSVPASPVSAYVLLAPGWDPKSATPPTSLVVMQSRGGLGLNLDETLHISVSDTDFVGNCASGSFLSQEQADVITQLVFPNDFGSFSYDAKTCTTTPIVGDAGAE